MTVHLAEEHRMLQDLVARFVDEQLVPLEPKIIERDIRGEPPNLTEEEAAPLLAKCKELGLWALDAPEELGGANLPVVALMAVHEELWRTIVPFTLPPDSPNLHMLMAVASPEQKKKYLALCPRRGSERDRHLRAWSRGRPLGHDHEGRDGW